MTTDPHPTARPYLSPAERKAAAGLGLALVGIAALVFFLPRKLTTVIDGCTPTSSITCTALVDSDNNSFAGIVLVVGGAAVLIAILGIRFSNVKVAGIELQGDFDDKTAGLPIVPSPSAGGSAIAAVTATNEGADQSDVGTVLAGFRHETYEGHHNIFLTHLLGKPTQPGQKYRVALFLVGHKRSMNRNEIKGAKMFFGGSWASQAFDADWGTDGRLGVVTEAFGPFLAVCEVELADGQTITLEHYVDFEMGPLVDAVR